ncbi:MAG: bifunctional 4-hydroxy-2-oxoglutarate aldolase/2-dehydro-3-deoxy-phosphogluconate aldolase [Anaerolineales bacterium]|nr:bifunctional 4-hydroxy-2-oxoglutarate aldolase/2-dehydro-3-deoxy-phosphogluconate aldolase [Anaerolineales bacterium]
MPNPMELIGRLGIVPVVRLEQPSEGIALARALLAGGLPCAEVTFRTQAAAEAIRQIVAAVPEVVVGAGTVVSVDQAEQAAEAGARFIVSPGFGPKVVAWCEKEQIPVMPGVATPSDILQALDAGLTLLKFFPAEALGGIATLEAIAAPFVGVRFVPTGGITAANLGAYLKLPAVFAVGGSWLVAPKLIAAGRFDEITRLTQEAVASAHQARGGAA